MVNGSASEEISITVIPDIPKDAPDKVTIESIDLLTQSELVKLIDLIPLADAIGVEGRFTGQEDIVLTSETSTNERIKYAVTAATNFHASQEFCKRIRNNPSQIFPGNERVGETEPFPWSTLVFLASRWEIPLTLIKMGSDPKSGHYTLALKNPEKIDGKWEVLIYDPLARGERKHILPDDWETNSASESTVLRNEIWGVDPSNYDLSVWGDNISDEDRALIESKRGKFQPYNDDYNCGLLCLFAAAIRMGIKGKADSLFNVVGRKQIMIDTATYDGDGMIPDSGVEILTAAQLGVRIN